MYITDETIDRLIREDIPYLDLTTHILNIRERKGTIRFTSRQKAVISGTDIVARIFEKLGIRIINIIPSGTGVEAGEIFIEAQGTAQSLHYGLESEHKYPGILLGDCHQDKNVG